MLIARKLANHLQNLGNYFPIVSLTGPRQAGKTTLLKDTFPNYRYLSFETPDVRQAFLDDPRGFLNQYNEQVIFDEAQHVPDLFSYLQTEVDNDRRPGRFILSGSQNFLLRKSIGQSLAGRVGIAKLMPLDQTELKTALLLPNAYQKAIIIGSYPAVHADSIPVKLFYPSYVSSYLERDVSGLISATNLNSFQRFLGVCAGFAGQLLNYSNMATSVGVSVPTIQSWISILEQSYIVFRLPPYYRNFKKRLIKSPKLYFYDTGLLCYLLGIQQESEIRNYFQFGALFENYIVADAMKSVMHNGEESSFLFYRDSNGVEVDLVQERATKVQLWEIKGGETYRSSLTKNFSKVLANWQQDSESTLIYAGNETHHFKGTKVLPWDQLSW